MGSYLAREKKIAPFFDDKVRAKHNSKRPDFCKRCPIARCTLGYVPPEIGKGQELIVGEAAGEDERFEGKPFIGGAGTVLNNLLRIAGYARSNFSIINTIGCQPPLNIYPNAPDWSFSTRDEAAASLYHCYQHHLYPFVKGRDWKRILTLGNHAMVALTNRTGVTTWRGSPLALKWQHKAPPVVIPCIHPAALIRDGKFYSITATQDFRRQPSLPPEHYNLAPTLQDLKNFNAKSVSFDFEWDMQTGEITLCGIGSKFYEAIVVPFVPPYIEELGRIFMEADELIGHNIIGADLKYFASLGWSIKAKLIDTMFIQHLVQPDHLHGLGFVGTAWTHKLFWKGSGKDKEDEAGHSIPSSQYKTWNHPYAIPIKYGGYGGCVSEAEAFALYNARDVDGTYQASVALRQRLRDYDMEYVYENVSIPAAFICRDMTEKGLKIDKTQLTTIVSKYKEDLVKLEADLPTELRPYTESVSCNIPAPPQTYSEKVKACRGNKKDNTYHEHQVLTYLQPGSLNCPVCHKEIDSGPMKERKVIKGTREEYVRPWNKVSVLKEWLNAQGIKDVVSRETGRLKTDKSARKVWMREAKHNKDNGPSLVNTLVLLDSIKRIFTLRSNFAKDTLFEADRLYPNFKVHGTSEGRLSCTNPNFQNQPKEVKWIFGVDDPSYGFLNLDIIQGENMLTAFIAEDWERLKRLRTPDYDEHAALATLSFGLPVVKNGENAHLRDPGKVINHGMNYLLGEYKALEYVHLQGFTSFTLADIRVMREAWKKMNAGTAAWQLATQALIKRQGFLCNAFERKRWFTGRDYATKGMAFLPASTLADVVLRMMIALHSSRFPTECEMLNLHTLRELPEGWRLCGQVHDSLVLQGPAESHLECARAVSQVMIQPWRELDDFQLGVEVEWSGKGQPWGACKSIEVIKPWMNEVNI